MADFDQFESAEPVQTEEDPAAAFLAREQDDLAALEGDEFVGSESEPPQQTEQNEFGADAFGSEEPPANPTSAADAGMFDPLGDDQPTQLTHDMEYGGEAEGTFGEGAGAEDSSDLYTAIKQVDTQRAEPEKIRIWRENQQEMLVQKDVGSEEKKREWRDIAKKELEDWYKHSDEQLEKAVKNNKEGEAAFIQERDENVPGHEWERICRLCDFNPKSSRTSKDISRMRSILLQLKQAPLQRS